MERIGKILNDFTTGILFFLVCGALLFMVWMMFEFISQVIALGLWYTLAVIGGILVVWYAGWLLNRAKEGR